MLKNLFNRFIRATLLQKVCYVFGSLLILFSFWNLFKTFLRALPFAAMAIVGVILVVMAATKKI